MRVVSASTQSGHHENHDPGFLYTLFKLAATLRSVHSSATLGTSRYLPIRHN